MEGILLWVWPGCCSKVFLWADLTQPVGDEEVLEAEARATGGVNVQGGGARS